MPVNCLMIAITSDASAVATVRHVARQVDRLLETQVDIGQIALLTSEVVGNAVRAGAGEVTTTFTRAGENVRVEVHDHGGGWPVMRHPAPLDDDGGRGLWIVNALAALWGADSCPERGTTVWFEVPGFPPPPTETPRDVAEVLSTPVRPPSR